MGLSYHRPYSIISIFHCLVSFVLLASGIAWLCLSFFYFPQQRSEGLSYHEAEMAVYTLTKELTTEWKVLFWIIFAAQTISGFFMFVASFFGFCVKDKGGLERFFMGLMYINLFIFAPLAIISSIEILFNVVNSEEFQSKRFIFSQKAKMSAVFNQLELYSDDDKYPWILTFPIVGMVCGLIEGVLSLITVCECCFCRPTRAYAF